MDLNDSELIKLEKVLHWAEARAGQHLDIDQFTKDVEEQINFCGFTCVVKVFDTDQKDAYGFEVEITGRTADSLFDPDRQVHEVTNNLLELPGQDKGFIPSKEYIDKLAQREFEKQNKKRKHKH